RPAGGSPDAEHRRRARNALCQLDLGLAARANGLCGGRTDACVRVDSRRAMSRVLPYPILSFCLLAMWVLLQGSADPAILVSGVAIALVAPWTLAALEMTPMKLRRPIAIVKLLGLVIFDVVRSNIAVATIIYGG